MYRFDCGFVAAYSAMELVISPVPCGVIKKLNHLGISHERHSTDCSGCQSQTDPVYCLINTRDKVALYDCCMQLMYLLNTDPLLIISSLLQPGIITFANDLQTAKKFSTLYIMKLGESFTGYVINPFTFNLCRPLWSRGNVLASTSINLWLTAPKGATPVN